MTFVFWTFLKNNKCPFYISSTKSFFAALKNWETNEEFIVALKMVSNTFVKNSKSISFCRNIKSVGIPWLHYGSIT